MIALDLISKIHKTPRLFPLSLNQYFQIEISKLVDAANILNDSYQPNRAKNETYALGFTSLVNISEH